MREDGDGVGSLPGANGCSGLASREPLKEAGDDEGNEETNSSRNFNDEIETLDDRSEDDGREDDHKSGSNFDPFVGSIASPRAGKGSKDSISKSDAVKREGRDDIEDGEENDDVRDDLGPNGRGVRTFKTVSRVVLPVQ